ncbi:MAG: hypothetical protein RL757_422 [Bacteroidota bacterium]|jgi:hypothetical protein
MLPPSIIAKKMIEIAFFEVTEKPKIFFKKMKQHFSKKVVNLLYFQFALNFLDL